MGVASTPPAFDQPDRPAHPNTPRSGVVFVYFCAVVLAGVLGGTIGWGLVGALCSDAPLLGERLLEGAFAGYAPHARSCDLPLLAGAMSGGVVGSGGAGVLAVLMMRAQSEWRTHPPPRV